MGTMSRMRSMAPWFMITVGGLFILFMVFSDSRFLDFARTQKQNVGSIDGQDISYQEYNSTVEQYRKNQEQQSGQQITEEQMDYFRDQIWDMMVSQKLVDKKIKEFGIVVTDEEIKNALLGPNPPEMLKKQFTDTAGVFNRQAYESALKDPRNHQIVVGLEDQIRQQLIQQKMQSYFYASITASDAEAMDKFVSQNIKMKANFISVDANTIPDNEVKVTDADIEAYYNKHSEDYKVENMRKLKYVLFSRIPSQGDSTLVKKNLLEVVNKVKSDTASFKSYVQSYSEQPYKRDTISIPNLSPELRNVLVKANKGEIVGPIPTFEGYVVAKLIDRVSTKNELVRASHILVRSTGNDAADKKKIDDIYNELMKGANFAKVAMEKSDDGSKTKGGDLDWFGKGQMVKPFEDACFSGKVGIIQKPIKTQFGYHIIKVTDRTNQSYVIEKIVNKVQISATTADKVYQDASDFSYVAKENGFETEAKSLKYNAIETPEFLEETRGIPGIGLNHALVKWAFDNKVGEISDVYKIPAGYVVATVSSVIKPGVKPLQDVKEGIKAAVLTQKKLEKALSIAKNIKKQIGTNGDASAAKTIWAAARVDTTNEFTTAGNVSNIGREYAFTEAAYKAELNKWTEPVKGKNSVFLIMVKYKTDFQQATFNSEKEMLKKNIMQGKKNAYIAQWIEQLKKEAKIVDDRYLFFK